MKTPIHVAVVGGSGSGKTWLAGKIVAALAPCAARVSLDDFYRDLSPLLETEREIVNFDDPATIDWEKFREVMAAMRVGEAIDLPLYDFATHTRKGQGRVFSPPALVVWDGLWLLHHDWLCPMFAITMFVDCGAEERFRRRAERDMRERGRTLESVHRQFFTHVEPMHGRFVEPQRRLAGQILASPVETSVLDGLLRELKKSVISPVFEPAVAERPLPVS